MAEAFHSMQTVLSQILANQQGVLANQELLIRNQQYLMKREKYLFSQQKLATPYVSKAKGLQEHQKPDNAGLHWGKGKILEKKRRETILEKEKLRWKASLEKEKLGLPDHLQPSRIIISNFRYSVCRKNFRETNVLLSILFFAQTGGSWNKGRVCPVSEQHCRW